MRRSELRKAYDLYQQSLHALSEVGERHPTQMVQLAGDFIDLAKGYRKVVEQLVETGAVPSIITVIEQSQAVPKVPLSELPSTSDSGSSTLK